MTDDRNFADERKSDLLDLVGGSGLPHEVRVRPRRGSKGRPLSAQESETFEQVVRQAIRELCDAYEVKVDKRGESAVIDAEELTLVSFIGIGSEGLRGTIVLRMDPRLAVATYPISPAKGAKSDTLDWASELVNQLAGRVKTKVRRYGVEFALSTPLAISGSELRIRAAAPSRTVSEGFATSAGRVIVFLSVVVTDSFAIPAEPLEKSPDDDLAEGDMLMF